MGAAEINDKNKITGERVGWAITITEANTRIGSSLLVYELVPLANMFLDPVHSNNKEFPIP